ncbi:hypothetical protein [Zavarzinia aquatilis]|uniref:Uncharacterized protein n=1 Tax=Zavarzinia aquatilis TaxID=2211142 RepID=A0A317EE02_9PROT|nr:hypothetical protein [Zavarzinia aquatilis]PWR24981.1 hypothetical protein DKG74_04220 [Zavarzinia aquatilis]
MAAIYLGLDVGKEFRTVAVSDVAAPSTAIVLTLDDTKVTDKQQVIVALQDLRNYLVGADWPPPET